MSNCRGCMGTVDPQNLGANQSQLVTSTSSEDLGLGKYPAYSPRLAEIVVVIIVLAIWAVAVFVFLRRWASIRIFQPMEPRYRHNPKNLDSVRIVKRTQDSVIYKNHNKKLSFTIVEREKKRLQRMHTIAALPTIEMEEFIAENPGRIEQFDVGPQNG